MSDPESAESEFSSKNPEPGWISVDDAAEMLAQSFEFPASQIARNILLWRQAALIESKTYEKRSNATKFVRFDECKEWVEQQSPNWRRSGAGPEVPTSTPPSPPEPEMSTALEVPWIADHMKDLQQQLVATAKEAGNWQREAQFYKDQNRILRDHISTRDARQILRDHPEIVDLPVTMTEDDANVPSRKWYWGWWRTPPATKPNPLPAQQEGQTASENGVEDSDSSNRTPGDSGA